MLLSLQITLLSSHLHVYYQDLRHMDKDSDYIGMDIFKKKMLSFTQWSFLKCKLKHLELESPINTSFVYYDNF